MNENLDLSGGDEAIVEEILVHPMVQIADPDRLVVFAARSLLLLLLRLRVW